MGLIIHRGRPIIDGVDLLFHRGYLIIDVVGLIIHRVIDVVGLIIHRRYLIIDGVYVFNDSWGGHAYSGRGSESVSYCLGVVLFLKASQEVRVTVTLNVTTLSRGTPTHMSTLG